MNKATAKGTADGHAARTGGYNTDREQRIVAAAWFTSSGLEWTDDNRRAYTKAFIAAM
jgi:hypothetical protein